MADNSYPVEVKIVSKNGWFTPQEAKNYYGRYSRAGITVHWWGDGTGASNHDNIVNYMAGQAQVELYKDLQLKSIADTNQEILNTLRKSAIIASGEAHDGGLLVKTGETSV